MKILDEKETFNIVLFFFRDVTAQDGGDYTCHASNKFGKIEEQGNLTVRGKCVCYILAYNKIGAN